MSAMIPLVRQADASLRRLRRRDRIVLAVYSLSGLAIIVAGELLAFQFDLAREVGIGPVLVRATTYLVVTTLLWSMLLRGNRALVAELLRELRSGYEAILLAYDSAISLKDAYTGGHGRRVAACAERLAAALGLAPELAGDVREAALLHDLGKIAVADAILTKPAALDAAESAVMRTHPVVGANILEAIPALSRHAPAVRHHHERYDGTGYPDRLSGERIPRAARIIAVADAWDALTTDRSYRRALARDEAMAELASVAGSQLDPLVVAALGRCVVDGSSQGSRHE